MCVLATISILYFYIYAYRRSYLDTHTHTRSHTHCICVYMFIYSLYNTYACSNTYVQCSLYNDGATLPEVPRPRPSQLEVLRDAPAGVGVALVVELIELLRHGRDEAPGESPDVGEAEGEVLVEGRGH